MIISFLSEKRLTMVRVGACARSCYQALFSPPPREPGDEARYLNISLSPPLSPSLAATYSSQCNPSSPNSKAYFDTVPVLSARAQTCTNSGTPPAAHQRKRHKCARARLRRARHAAVIHVKVTILTFEDPFKLTYRKLECDVVNKQAAAISGVYFSANFVKIHPRTLHLIKIGP